MVDESAGLVYSPSAPSCWALLLPSSLLWDVSEPSLHGICLPTKQKTMFSFFSVLVFYQTDELKWLMEISKKHRWERMMEREDGRLVTLSDNGLLNLLIPSQETDT